MRRKTLSELTLLSAFTCFLTFSGHAAGSVDPSKLRQTVDETIRPLIQKDKIPGMAVAVTVGGRNYFYDYGVASNKTQHPVTRETLFEIGSLSKPFAAILASYARVNGRLALSDSAGDFLPSLRNSRFGDISLLNLGTHTSSLPLFVPGNIQTDDQLLDYLQHWQPAHAAGTHRIYSNIGVGMLGMIAAKSMHESYDDAVEKDLFPQLGMTHSYINVPADRMKDYAQGYTAQDAPVRLNVGVLASEAYGVKSCTADLIRFLAANMRMTGLDRKLQRAITDTHTGYFRSGGMTQALVWEQYPYPVGLKRVLAGNAATAQDAIATPFRPPLPPQADVLINKTGSTNGFAAYEAFIPARKLGIVILANKSYPIDQRVTAAYQILTRLDRQTASKNDRSSHRFAHPVARRPI